MKALQSSFLTPLTMALSLLFNSALTLAGEQHPKQHSERETPAAAPTPVVGVTVVPPEVIMVDQHGKKQTYKEAIDDGRPVFLNFIFVSCNGICPVLSQLLSKVQAKLGPEAAKVHLVSVSIDPESDTPEKLLAHAKKFKAGPGWDYYTGSANDSIKIQKAFNAFGGDKMRHPVVTFVRYKPGEQWMRIDGFVSPDRVVEEYKSLQQKSQGG